jgi:hypothetical protein
MTAGSNRGTVSKETILHGNEDWQGPPAML